MAKANVMTTAEYTEWLNQQSPEQRAADHDRMMRWNREACERYKRTLANPQMRPFMLDGSGKELA